MLCIGVDALYYLLEGLTVPGHFFRLGVRQKDTMEKLALPSLVDDTGSPETGSPEAARADKHDDLEAPVLVHWYCPLTQALVKDPVVHPITGETYERMAIADEKSSNIKLYPNRALKEYIELCVTGMNGVRSRTTEDLLVKPFQCSITFDLMRDPVIDSDGYSYERAAIVDWIGKHGTSPITREKLTIDQLADNRALFVILFELVRTGKLVNADTEQWTNDLSTPPGHLAYRPQTLLHGSPFLSSTYRVPYVTPVEEFSDARATYYALDHTGRQGRSLSAQQADRKCNCSLILLCFLFFTPAILISLIFMFVLSTSNDTFFSDNDSRDKGHGRLGHKSR